MSVLGSAAQQGPAFSAHPASIRKYGNPDSAAKSINLRNRPIVGFAHHGNLRHGGQKGAQRPPEEDLIIDQKHLISGGQPVAVFEQALRQIAAGKAA